MIASALLLLCSAVVCPEPPLVSGTATRIQIKDGLEQYPGDLKIYVSAILRVEAFKTLFRKVGAAMVRRLTEEDRLELKAKFIAPYLFEETRVHIWTRFHREEGKLLFDSVVAEFVSGHIGCAFCFPSEIVTNLYMKVAEAIADYIGCTFLIPPDPVTMKYLKIEVDTKDVKVDQRKDKQPILSAGIELRLVLKKLENDPSGLKTEENLTVLGVYDITNPYRFTLPPYDKKVLWGQCIWNYFVDPFWAR